MISSVSTIIDSAAFAGSDRKKLLALVQAKQEAEADEEKEAEEDEVKMGAPDPAAYKTHSTSIVDVLEDLKEKAEAELSDLRKAETNTQHNFNMLKQSLEDQIAFDTKDMEEEKEAKLAAEETKATAEGDLAITVKALANAKKALETAQMNCMQVAAYHEVTIKSRAEELAAIAEAKKILMETTAGAVDQTYSP